MQFDETLLQAELIRRYKRFLADVELDNGELLTVYSPNTGSMKSCSEPGCKIWISKSGNQKRKYGYTLELIETPAGILVGINTGLTNSVVKEGIIRGVVTELQGYGHITEEVRYGKENSRIDLKLHNDHQQCCYVEIKNVTWVEDGIAYFPDAVTSRGSKHLRELTAMVRLGHRAVLLFCIMRADAELMQPADDVDAIYGQTLRTAIAAGVEVYAYFAKVSLQSVVLFKPVPVVCP